ncbi:hypothetical protein E2C01_076023 [Portunus trituberculatus]|uniref:Uncharacterized protein n=1 Tax=Portunus trituberculatus TaxID=210409 RepID=A0A5B7IKX9_PORTR|nr:hypothetical protein [Portunus trituberculatus]
MVEIREEEREGGLAGVGSSKEDENFVGGRRFGREKKGGDRDEIRKLEKRNRRGRGRCGSREAAQGTVWDESRVRAVDVKERGWRRRKRQEEIRKEMKASREEGEGSGRRAEKKDLGKTVCIR